MDRIISGTSDANRENSDLGLAASIGAMAYGVPLRAVFADPRGDAKVASARHMAMYLAHVDLKLSARRVGRGFGRTHAAVLKACHAIEDNREDPIFDRTVEWLEILLKRSTEASA